eukprot:14093554-Alexandrium_andersonii.AAC.1
MVNDLFEERKDKNGNGTGEYYCVDNPPANLTEQITELCQVMRQWPKQYVILGAEGSQWPFMEGKGHNKLAQHLVVIGDQLAQQGVLVMHGRQMWNGLKTANDGVRLTWELHTIFQSLGTFKA